MSTLLTSNSLLRADPPKAPFLSSKGSNLSVLQNPKQTQQRFAPKTISCKAEKDDANIESKPVEKAGSPMLDRRNVLLGGLGTGLYGASATLGGGRPSLAAPLEPDFTTCFLKDYKGGGPAALPCCPTQLLTKADQIPAFDPDKYRTPLKVRPSAHSMTPVQLAKFREAISRMKNLPDTDPRSFTQQANIHCAYCDGAYRQIGHPDLDFKVHFSWLFLPFHRAYLYFFERILGKLMDDETIALPFWNWDHPQGMNMPLAYTQEILGYSKDYDLQITNPLFDPKREPKHVLPSTLMDLKYIGYDTGRTSGDFRNLVYDNLCLMKAAMVYATDPESFMGGRWHGGEGYLNQMGTLERGPHNWIHEWVGDSREKYNENMGVFYAAGRDPLFYCHHANVDRMWSIWKTLGGGRKDFDEPDFLNTYFVFYDENAEPVKIYVKDVLDSAELSYDYEEIEIPWEKPAEYLGISFDDVDPVPVERVDKLPKMLYDKFRLSNVKRPKPVTTPGAIEVLNINLDLLHNDVFIKFDVYINRVSEKVTDTATIRCKSYAGSYTSLPERPSESGAKKGVISQKLRVPIAGVLKELGAENDPYLDLVFVPAAGNNAVNITGAKIAFDTQVTFE